MITIIMNTTIEHDAYPTTTRELLDLYNSAQQRGDPTCTEDLLELLVLKDKELKKAMDIG